MVPTLVDGGLVVTESALILGHLDREDSNAALMPSDRAGKNWLLRCLARHPVIGAKRKDLLLNGLQSRYLGQALVLVRPLIRAAKTMPLAGGMRLAVHPGHDDGRAFAEICDNDMIEAGGPGDCLRETDKKIFEL